MHYGHDSEWLFWVATAIAVIGGILLIIVLIIILLTKKKFTNYNEDVLKEVRGFLNQENQNKYSDLNIRWGLAPDLFYITIERVHFYQEYDRGEGY